MADKWEHSELRLIPSDPERMLAFILKESLAGNMAPHTPGLFYFALVRRFGRHTVEHALKKVLRRKEWKLINDLSLPSNHLNDLEPKVRGRIG